MHEKIAKAHSIDQYFLFIDGVLQGLMGKLEDLSPENVEKEKWVIIKTIATIEKNLARKIGIVKKID